MCIVHFPRLIERKLFPGPRPAKEEKKETIKKAPKTNLSPSMVY